MLIDWVTVIAQIVNFLVLVALLKHFLYGRLIGAMDRREKRIADRLSEAADKNKAAERQTELMKIEKEDQQRKSEQLMVEARQRAEAEYQDMMRQAREDVKRQEAQWREDLARQRQALLDEIRRRASLGILAVIRRALSELASADLQNCAMQVFLEKLRSLDPSTLNQLAADELTVSTPVELSDEWRRTIEGVVNKGGYHVSIRFNRVPAMGWGIELSGNGLRIGWNPDTYLETVEANLKDTLEHRLEMVA
jgi:F-type H+-transporting ATPase subunit b